MQDLDEVFFWIAVGAAAVAYLYFQYRQHRAGVELVQQSIARGETLTPELLDRLFPKDVPAKKSKMPPHIAARTVGIVLIFAGIGLGVFGWILLGANFPAGTDLAKAAGASYAIFGTGALVGCVGLGVLVASRFMQNASTPDSNT